MDETHQYNIRLPDVLYKRLLLIPKGQRSKFIVESLESSLSFQDQSIARLQREIEEVEKNLQIKKDLLSKKIDTFNQKVKTEKILKTKYEDFLSYLENPEFVYNTKRVNDKFGTSIKNYKHFQEIEMKNKNKNFSIEDFKKLIES